ncbi:PREDICTED: uncharacterized protein LOC109350600 [Lupinus angustifolius]|uniref:uncharacterized protein LOC109350600 n=1 Tax=Lupinus angustifolius TaxID=3871 RepID=UPI00092E2340|nr:PREDICTED: uncharacterized protein LOC109350600 [Lupinus angustifolius]
MSVLMNGTPSNQFSVSKGIKQGDPMMPFLFLLVAKGFVGLVRMAKIGGILEGFKMRRSEVEVTNLQFADDTIMVFKPTTSNLWESFMRLAVSFLSCKIGTIPFVYLGIPVGANSRSVSMWKSVVDVVARRLASWKRKHISFGENRQALIADYGVWINESWSWRISCIRHLFSWEEDSVDRLYELIIYHSCRRGISDRWRWGLNAYGVYTVKSAYMAQLEYDTSARDDLLNKCWISCILMKVYCFVWKTMRGSLATKGELQRRHIMDGLELNCVFCLEHIESTNHLLLACSFTFLVWK